MASPALQPIRTISILGCGWLGFPLAQALVAEGYTVKGSTTSPNKIGSLEEAGIQPFLLSVKEEVEAAEKADFFDADLLFLNIPPGGRRDPQVEDTYPQKIKAVLNELHQSPVRYLLFCSSTGVYGSNNDWVDENSPLAGETASGRALEVIERFLALQQHPIISVLRLAGLVGGNRKPGRFLAGKKDLPNGEAPVNLVHREDCIGIILELIRQGAWGETFNVVADEHPTRAAFYTVQAEKLGLEPPTFVGNKQLSYKLVSNDKVKRVLKYRFRYPDPKGF